MSTGGAAIKSTTLSAIEVASLRSGVAALLLLALTRAWRGRWDASAAAVGASMAATMVLFVAANKLTTAANTIFLQSTAPIYVMLAAPRLLGESIRGRDVAHVLALSSGLVMFFVGAPPPAATAPEPMLGNLLAVASGVTWAGTVLGIRWLAAAGASRAQRSSAAPALVTGNVLAFAVGLPWLVGGAGELVSGADAASNLAAVVYLGTFQVGLAYYAFDRGARHVPAVEASLLLLVEPALNPVWAWLVHGERPGAWALAGGAVVLASTAAKTVAEAVARPRAGAAVE